MSYKLTSLYGIAHGHAVALCMPFAWETLIERGDNTARKRLCEVASLMTGDEGGHPQRPALPSSGTCSTPST